MALPLELLTFKACLTQLVSVKIVSIKCKPLNTDMDLQQLASFLGFLLKHTAATHCVNVVTALYCDSMIV